MTLPDYLRLLRRGWPLVVSLTLLGISLGVLATSLTPAKYGAVASVIITTTTDGTPGSLQLGSDFATSRAATYAGLATSAAVLERAAATTGDDPRALRSSVVASTRVGTSLIDVQATGTSARLAADRANAVAAALNAQVPALDARAAAASVQITTVTQAQPALTPESPRPRNNLVIGAIVGLALGVGALIVANALDTRIRSIADLPRGAAVATVTSLPADSRRRPGRGGPRLESFRHLRANLQFSSQSGGAIAITGVTSAANSLAVSKQLSSVLGEVGLEVVVVDADLRIRDVRASKAQLPGPAVGVAEVLGGTATIDEVLTAGSSEGLWLIGAGAVKESSAQMLNMSAMRDFLATLTERFDYVLLACPPLVDRSEASVLAALSDSSLVIVEAAATKRADLLYALELLAGVGVLRPNVALDRVRRVDLGRTPPVQQSTAPTRP